MFGVRKGLDFTPRDKDAKTLEVLTFFASTVKKAGEGFTAAGRIVGRFEQLRQVSLGYPGGLCEYVEVTKSAYGRIFVVAEGGTETLAASVRKKNLGERLPLADVRRWARELLHALAWLHAHGVVHGIHGHAAAVVGGGGGGSVRLAGFGLFFLTGGGADVQFPIGSPRFYAPEVICNGPSCHPSNSNSDSDANRSVFSPKADVWALGMLLLEILLADAPEMLPSPLDAPLPAVFAGILAWAATGGPPSESLHAAAAVITSSHLNSNLNSNSNPNSNSNSPDEDQKDQKEDKDGLISFLRACLAPRPAQRPSASELLHHPFLAPDNTTTVVHSRIPWERRPHLPDHSIPLAASSDHVADAVAPSPSSNTTTPSSTNTHLDNTPLPQTISPSTHPIQLYDLLYLWRLAGGDLEILVFKTGATNTPAIRRLPKLVRNGENVEELLAASHAATNLFSDTLVQIPLDHIHTKIDALNTGLIPQQSTLNLYNDQWKRVPEFTASHMHDIWHSFLNSSQIRLALSAKEMDFNYQYLRICLFYRLLRKYPCTAGVIRNEAVSDVPPLLRGKIWAALLNVHGDPTTTYTNLDTQTHRDTDHQLDLDIPRCHQYNAMLASPVGHRKLKRVLKSWILCEEGRLVYWQGLDSMCAPFITLNFGDEALAFASMRAFISHFCPGFFVHDNSKLMREFMLAFRYLLSFHDPELSSHLHTIGLGPELFAISWFMTLYAHVFTLDKIYHLWDHLLVGPPFLSMYMGVSILQQHRDYLLASDFNQAMVMFSETPPVNIEQCIITSIQAAKITPPSLLAHLQSPLVDHETHKVSPGAGNEWDVVKRFSFMNNKKGIVGGVSISDFIEMRHFVTVLDARKLDLYKEGHVKGSIHVRTDHTHQPIPFGMKLILTRSRYIIVVTTGEDDENGVATMLVREKYPYVALMVVSDVDMVMQCGMASMGVCACTPQPIGGCGGGSGTATPSLTSVSGETVSGFTRCVQNAVVVGIDTFT